MFQEQLHPRSHVRATAPTQRKRRVRTDWLTLPIGALALLMLWQLVVMVGDIPAFILPAPRKVAQSFAEMISTGRLWPHVGVTLFETLAGFAIGFAVATVVGYALAKRPHAERAVAPWLVAMQAVPIVALAPLLVSWLGVGLASKIAVSALIVFFPILINTIIGVRSVDQEWHELLSVLHATRWQRFRHLELPAALPVLFGGIKLGITLAVVGAVVGEFIGARTGLGALINIARGGFYDTALLFVALITLALMALALYSAVVLLERLLVRWRR
ncbi:MAG: ABC transporter permease [Anaerolineales bacterium]|nr:ABC transporter permease [Anaerolineales bacterium]MCB9127530.1 ABC transporter permease [Ardenticatenales bacterium]